MLPLLDALGGWGESPDAFSETGFSDRDLLRSLHPCKTGVIGCKTSDDIYVNMA